MDFQLSNLALHHLVMENQFLVNGFVNKVQTTPDGLLKIKVHTKEGDKNVIVTSNAFFVSESGISAKQNPGGFSAFLKKHLYNQRIIKIEQSGFDRIVLFEFPEKILILELFSKGNIILCDKEMNILKANRKETWKDRSLEIGAVYKFPSSKGKNPLEINSKDFFNELQKNKKSFFGAVIDIINVAPGLLDDLFEREGIDKKKNATQVSEKEAKKVLTALAKLYGQKEAGAFVKGGIIYSAKVSGETINYDNITNALNVLNFSEKKTNATAEEKKVERKSDYVTQIKKALLEEKEFKSIGEAIYLHYNDLSEIIKEIKELKEKGLSAKEIETKIRAARSSIKGIVLEANKARILF